MAAAIPSISCFMLAVILLLAVVQRSVAPPKSASNGDKAQAGATPKGLTPQEKIQKIADFAYATKGCVKYERYCAGYNLDSLQCVKTSVPGRGAFSIYAYDLAWVLDKDTRTDIGDPTFLMVDHAFCKGGQDPKEYAKRIFPKARFIEYMTSEAHHITELIDDGSIIGNLLVWMGKQMDYSDIDELPAAEKKLRAQDETQAELMVKFIFDEEKGRPEVPARPACKEVRKVCADGDPKIGQIVKLVSLDCTKPDKAKSVTIWPNQLSAIGTQGGTRLGDLLCAQWPGEDVCIDCSRAKIKDEIMEDMFNVRKALKNASVKGRLTAFTNDWMIKFLEPKKGGAGGIALGTGGGGAAPR